eukprot:6261088-Pyramimonas_sp.AAC.1
MHSTPRTAPVVEHPVPVGEFTMLCVWSQAVATLAGEYSVAVVAPTGRLDKKNRPVYEELYESPVEVQVLAGPLHPPSCTARFSAGVQFFDDVAGTEAGQEVATQLPRQPLTSTPTLTLNLKPKPQL